MTKTGSRMPKRTVTGNCLVSIQGRPNIYVTIRGDRQGKGDKDFDRLTSFFELLESGSFVRLEGDWWRVYQHLRVINHPNRIGLEKRKISDHLVTYNPMGRSPTKNGKKTQREKPTNAKFGLLHYSKDAPDDSEEIDSRLKKKKVMLVFNDVPEDRVENITKFVNAEKEK